MALSLAGAACDGGAIDADASTPSTVATCTELCEAQIDGDCRSLGAEGDPCGTFCADHQDFMEVRGCSAQWDAFIGCLAASPTCPVEPVCIAESDAVNACVDAAGP